MFVDEIRLKDFRNYKNGYVRFENKVNIIYGDNARGKTNILEGVYLLSAARSHRLARDNEMISFGEKSAKITALFNSHGRFNTGEISLFYDKKKQIKINKVPIEKASGLIGCLNAVMFCPEDLRLVKGAPRERRRMMDLGICQVSKKYFHSLSQYVKVLEQRNRLLKENPESKTLWVWDEKLIQYGTEVIWHRMGYINSLCAAASAVHGDICGERLDIIYKCSVLADGCDSKDAVSKSFASELKRNSEREKRFGMSLVGPHRDDFEIKINGVQARLYGSQGQQRTAVLALKMGEVSLINESVGEMPILLLDDVMSELDLSRQSYILNNIRNIQVIITCTAPFEYENANIINVEDVKR